MSSDLKPGTSRRAGRKLDDTPGTITHRKVAEKLGITSKTLRRWVENGNFPRPISVIESIWFYREDLIRGYLTTGQWPEGASFNRPRSE